ncbi:hypothetical protein KC328_g17221, partial [Hortaea werneckii]
MASSVRTAMPRTTPRNLTRHLPSTPSLRQQRRWATNLQAPDSADPKLRQIDVGALEIQKTTTPKPIVPHDQLVFGRTFTDHMMSL